MPQNRWIARLLGLMCLFVLGLLAGVAGPAGADHAQQNTSCLPYPWESEEQLSLLPFVSPNGNDCWRPVVWPGASHLLNREQTYAFESFYGGQGYDNNFLWYAPIETIEVADYENRLWTGCNHIPAGVRQLCTSINTSLVGPSFNTTTANPELTVIKWGQDWISLVCGNNLQRIENDSPVPSIPIDKFIDENRNGVVDGNDVTSGAKVAGVDFEIWRTSSPSWVNQTTGLVATVSTNSNGDAKFLLDGHGPGTYEIREVVPSGSIPTTPAVRTVVVEAGIGDRELPLQRFGNAPDEADAEKIEFVVSNAPAVLDVRTDTFLSVDVTIRNNGPADHVPVEDVVVASSPNEDCVFTESEQTIRRVLRRGESYSHTFVFVVTCDLPSDHSFEFTDELRITDEWLTDIDLTNNTAIADHDAEVHAKTDFGVNADIDCPDRTDVDTDTTCSVTLDVSADGYGPAEGQVEWVVTGPADCTVAPANASHVVELDDDETTTITFDHVASCADRSFHDFVVEAGVTPVDEHVFDLVSDNDSTNATDRVEVFEAADLTVIEADLWLSCDEYFGPDPFNCEAVVPVTNLGTAPEVVTLTTATLSAEDCTATPDPQTAVRTVDVGETVNINFQWSVECGDPTAVHVLYLDVCVTNDPSDPHAEDRNPVNDCGRVAAVPIDFKPLSDPNTVNLGRGGVTSVAILSSPTFDPFAQVDTTQPITFGPTGTEAAATRCATEGEDANADGYDRDLTCKFRNTDIGLAIGDEQIYLIGYLVDGTRFIGTEQVRVI